eukprot:TRINITY_DN16816_c1_g1_i2.p1 TRINITY_DN16816_c1_g1~~TRINITY_DN16816_c1_g1_i2.p1  ORF type:complete len:161 (+),score=33.01 TRINITY_DN16816_c1_g1_i2:80-562(+)
MMMSALFFVVLVALVGCAVSQAPLLTLSGQYPASPNAFRPTPPNVNNPDCTLSTTQERASSFTYTFTTAGVYRVSFYDFTRSLVGGGAYYSGNAYVYKSDTYDPANPCGPVVPESLRSEILYFEATTYTFVVYAAAFSTDYTDFFAYIYGNVNVSTYLYL